MFPVWSPANPNVTKRDLGTTSRAPCTDHMKVKELRVYPDFWLVHRPQEAKMCLNPSMQVELLEGQIHSMHVGIRQLLGELLGLGRVKPSSSTEQQQQQLGSHRPESVCRSELRGSTPSSLEQALLWLHSDTGTVKGPAAPAAAAAPAVCPSSRKLPHGTQIKTCPNKTPSQWGVSRSGITKIARNVIAAETWIRKNKSWRNSFKTTSSSGTESEQVTSRKLRCSLNSVNEVVNECTQTHTNTHTHTFVLLAVIDIIQASTAPYPNHNHPD